MSTQSGDSAIHLAIRQDVSGDIPEKENFIVLSYKATF